MSDFEEIVKKANEGDAEAQCSLGFVYMCGMSVEKDYDLAKSWLRKSAKQGFAKAYRHLAELYMEGNGVPKSLEMGIYYAKIAERRGDTDAHTVRILCQRKRMGELNPEPEVELWHYYMRDPSHFIEYYEKAIEVEIANGPFRLGYIYEQMGDYENAVKYYKLGEIRHAGDAIYRLGYLYEKGLGVEKSRLHAYSYYRRAETHGDLNACNTLGCILCQSHLESKSGIEDIKKAADGGHSVAKLNLAYIYSVVPEIKAPFEVKVSLYTPAAEEGNLSAKLALGYLYMNAEGENRDYASAMKHFAEAGMEGNVDAEFMAGFIAEHHLDMMRNAAYHYRRAADEGHPLAMYYLSECYRDGRGVEENGEIADELFEKSGIGDDI